jgi:hypothetical protein
MFHVTGTPWSLHSFLTDVGAALMETIRNGSIAYAEGEGPAEAAVIESRGGAPGTSNEFLADVTPYSTGSDHDDYDSSTIAVPSLYLRDWPDIYIHTDHDTLQQIDPTKLRRVALLGAASGYVYASVNAVNRPGLLPYFIAQSKMRLAQAFQKALRMAGDPRLDADAAWYEAENLLIQAARRESGVLQSFIGFSGGPVEAWKEEAWKEEDPAMLLAEDGEIGRAHV